MDTKYFIKSSGILVIDRGAWVSGTVYSVGNLVQDNGSYICKVAHTSGSSTEPGVGASWATYWKALQVVTGTYESSYFKATSTIPYFRLIDGSVNDVSIRLNAGILEFYDNENTTLRASMHMATGALTVPSLVVPDKTDGQVSIPLEGGVALSGTWVLSDASNVLIVTRTAAAATHYYRMGIILPSRTTALKGIKLKSVKVSYTIATADTAADELKFEIIKTTIPATGSDATATVLAGDSDADYDTAHNTKAERLATESHTLTVTIPTGEQAFLAADQILSLRCRVTDAATGNLVLVLTGAVALFNYQEQ